MNQLEIDEIVDVEIDEVSLLGLGTKRRKERTEGQLASSMLLPLSSQGLPDQNHRRSEDERIDVLGLHSIKQSLGVEIGELGFSFSGSLYKRGREEER